MYWHVITVSKKDFGLTLGAIGLGGGTVTATKPSGGAIAITYVTNDEVMPPGRPLTNGGRAPRRAVEGLANVPCAG